jgi:phosphatidylglycerophosphate synthase
MKISRQDLLSPANLVTLCGLALTVAGSIQLDTFIGFLAVLSGRILDLFDGPIARRTHTSRFGAVLDATVDKLAILAMITGMLAFGLAPIGVMGYILAQNVLVSGLNTIASLRKITVHTTDDGKHNVFLQISSMLLFVLASFVQGPFHDFIIGLAYLALATSLYSAFYATKDYFRMLRPKPHNS